MIDFIDHGLRSLPVPDGHPLEAAPDSARR